MTSCVSKVFNRIIAKSISKFLEDHDALSEIQGDSERIIDAKTISLRSRASLQQDWRKIIQPFLLSWISGNSFDTVWRDGLLSTAWNLGIRGNAWKLIDSLYSNVQAKVKFGDFDSDFFEVGDGVKQGCVLSPILFCAYINELAKLIKECDLGVRICNVNNWLSFFFFFFFKFFKFFKFLVYFINIHLAAIG